MIPSNHYFSFHFVGEISATGGGALVHVQPKATVVQRSFMIVCHNKRLEPLKGREAEPTPYEYPGTRFLLRTVRAGVSFSKTRNVFGAF